jgi:hypothetical protein
MRVDEAADHGVAVSMSLFHLYIAYAGPPNAFTCAPPISASRWCWPI